MTISPLRRPAAASTAKPSVKGLCRSTRWSSLAMLEGEEDDLVYLTRKGEDRLSTLPDDVLLDITERLGIAEATRASILSRRWRRIPAMLSNIRITIGSVHPEHDRAWDGVVRANAAVVRAAMSLLQSRTATPRTISLLCVEFFLGHGAIGIGQTIANIIATHKVGSTDFTIFTEKETQGCTSGDMLAYGRELGLFFKSCPGTLSGLTRLKLENVRLAIPLSDLSKLFGLCEQLEFLRLHNCDLGLLSFLEVEHPHLRELEIVRCKFERVDLKWLPELKTLTFSCWPCTHDPLSFGDVPLLQTVSASKTALWWHKMHKLSEFLDKTTVNNLHLNFRSEKIWVEPEGPIELSQVFNKLRLVNLTGISEECDLTWTMFVLQGAPGLKELCIRVSNCLGIWERKPLPHSQDWKDACAKWEASASDFKHYNLSVLRIIGFQSEDKFVNYVTAVIESAVNLKDIYLHERPVCENCKYGRWRKDRYPRTKRERVLVCNSLGMDTRLLLTLHFPSLRERCYGSAR